MGRSMTETAESGIRPATPASSVPNGMPCARFRASASSKESSIVPWPATTMERRASVRVTPPTPNSREKRTSLPLSTVMCVLVAPMSR